MEDIILLFDAAEMVDQALVTEWNLGPVGLGLYIIKKKDLRLIVSVWKLWEHLFVKQKNEVSRVYTRNQKPMTGVLSNT